MWDIEKEEIVGKLETDYTHNLVVVSQCNPISKLIFAKLRSEQKRFGDLVTVFDENLQKVVSLTSKVNSFEDIRLVDEYSVVLTDSGSSSLWDIRKPDRPVLFTEEMVKYYQRVVQK